MQLLLIVGAVWVVLVLSLVAFARMAAGED